MLSQELLVSLGEAHDMLLLLFQSLGELRDRSNLFFVITVGHVIHPTGRLDILLLTLILFTFVSQD